MCLALELAKARDGGEEVVAVLEVAIPFMLHRASWGRTCEAEGL